MNLGEGIKPPSGLGQWGADMTPYADSGSLTDSLPTLLSSP